MTTIVALTDSSQALRVGPIPIERGYGLTACGEFERHTAPLCESAIATMYSILEGVGADRFILDFRGITFLDLGGIDALTRIDAQIENAGARLQFLGPHAGTPRWLINHAVGQQWLSPVFASQRPRMSHPVGLYR
jgi:anti-anti-sigma regulatory factor